MIERSYTPYRKDWVDDRTFQAKKVMNDLTELKEYGGVANEADLVAKYIADKYYDMKQRYQRAAAERKRKRREANGPTRIRRDHSPVPGSKSLVCIF